MSTRPRIGLALSSGGARGAAHVGVLKVFHRENVPVDVIAGTSVGAGVGGLYAAGISVEQIEKIWLQTDLKRVLRSYLPALSKSGWSKGEEITRSLSETLGTLRIEALKLPYAAIAADINTGQEVILREGLLIEAIRASSSIPAIFTPVLWQERYLVDGGLVNPVPVSVTRKLGAEIVIAVDVAAQPVEGFTEEPSMIGRYFQFPFDNRVTQFFKSRFKETTEEKIEVSARPTIQPSPTLLGVIMQSSSILQRQLISYRLQEDKPDLVITPKFSTIPRYWRAAEAIQAGETAAMAVLPQLRKILSLGQN
jgi:NTE family protein